MTTPLYLDLPRFSAPARCAETDPEAFVPERGGSAREAKRLCGACDVEDECLSYALEHRLVASWDGVWGGTSPRERKRILRALEARTARADVATQEAA